MRRAIKVVLVSLLLGCSGSDEVDDTPDGPVTTSSEVTVIVWSEHLKQAVPAQGAITSRADYSSQTFDTRSSPESGQSTTLPPGQYEIVVSYRIVSSGKQAVDGREVLYLEPGTKQTVTVVVTDTKDDLGYITPQELSNSPVAATPPLPLELSSG